MKQGYDSYFELCLALVRQGGVVTVDNTLGRGKVLKEDRREDTVAVKKVNEKLVKDDRLRVVRINILWIHKAVEIICILCL